MDEKALIEELSRLEHDQWVAWSKAIAKSENINEERHARWKKLWCPYKDLSEKDKDKDREWARKVFRIVKKNRAKESNMKKISWDQYNKTLHEAAFGYGRGLGLGRGSGFGRGWGMPAEPGYGMGLGGRCVCLGCGLKMTHERATPCLGMPCPECGTMMIRDMSTATD